MNTITVSGKTVELAIEQGLKQLNTTREQVLIVVIQEGKKGILGFGKQDALVSLTLKISQKVDETEFVDVDNEVVEVAKEKEDAVFENNIKKVEEQEVIKESSEKLSLNDKYKAVVDYLINVSKEYGADITVDIKETTKMLTFQIETERAGLLIGKYGKIINGLQVLVQTLVYRDHEKAPMVVVNIGDYRQKREEKLKEIAERTAKKVLRTRQAVYLEPLPAFERKIVHAHISKYDQLVTQSEGKEPHRYLKVEFNNQY